MILGGFAGAAGESLHEKEEARLHPQPIQHSPEEVDNWNALGFESGEVCRIEIVTKKNPAATIREACHELRAIELKKPWVVIAPIWTPCTAGGACQYMSGFTFVARYKTEKDCMVRAGQAWEPRRKYCVFIPAVKNP